MFFAVEAAPTFFTPEARNLLGPQNFPYFSGAFAQIALSRFFHFQIWCAIIAAAHLLAEWLYLGRPQRKVSFSLLAALFALALFSSAFLQPKLQQLHVLHYAVNVRQADRETAARLYRGWHLVSEVVNVFVIGGLIVYFWRMANPSGSARFVSSVKFRG